MATFPAINPDEGKVYSPGQVPTETYTGPKGVPYPFRLGTLQVGAPLDLPFTNRPMADIDAILDHHTAQQLDPFDLPAAVWCANTATATIAGAGLQWRYREPPSPERLSNGFGNITVRLVSAGSTIGPTTTATPAVGAFAGIIGAGVPTAPTPPTPIPDPPILPPTTTIAGPTELIVPPGVIAIGSAVELRHGTAGFMATGGVAIGSAVELRHGTAGLMATGGVEIGGTVTLSFDP